MSKKKLNGDDQVDTIDRNGPHIAESFDLPRLDDFVRGLGVQFLHYKGIPSPIGQRDIGDYRRSDGVDTITSNGMIYSLAGKFTATMTDNTRDRKRGEAGTLDPSQSKLVMPRFYDSENGIKGKRIYLSPGDRIYVADSDADVLVSSGGEKVNYDANFDNAFIFPVVELEVPIVDSRNMEYIQDLDFCITKEGNIRWIAGARNPGVDPNTGVGRVYTARYLYKSFWYITTLLKEVRITNVTDCGQRKPERMPYHCMVQREYIYHNQNRGNAVNQNMPKDKERVAQAPDETQNPSKYKVKVNMIDVGEDDEPNNR